MLFDDVALELAIIERLALEAVLQRIASQQRGEAFVDLDLMQYAKETPAQE